VTAAAQQRVVAVCADDFGQDPAISRGIARLAAAGRLTAISCLVNGPHWSGDAPLLQPLPASVDVGLHLNFTDGRPLSGALRARWSRFPSLPSLIVRAHARLLPRNAVQAEMRAQLDAFVAAAGRPPAFIDGHQHVHHLPVLRDAVLALASSMLPVPALRNTGRVLGPGNGVKRWLIERTGGRRLQRAMAEAGLRHNATLLGAYDFVGPDYRPLMQRWLDALPAEGGLLFCHPADRRESDHKTPPDAVTDPIGAARLREALYLGSDAFADDLRARNVTLGRAWQRAA
jgi:chitin disaccharide deacetylase